MGVCLAVGYRASFCTFSRIALLCFLNDVFVWCFRGCLGSDGNKGGVGGACMMPPLFFSRWLFFFVHFPQLNSATPAPLSLCRAYFVVGSPFFSEKQ